MANGGSQADDSFDDPDATRIGLRADPPSCLQAGTRLRDFEIEGVIGEGGFSIVYAAVDLNLRRRVALKEYMPVTLARREHSRSVQPRTGRASEVFELGRRSFLNEARLLAQFDHPSLVKVLQFWEENGTAYMVMPLYEGRTLKQWLKERSQPPGEDELRQLIAPLLDALEHLHADSVFHRDIAPDNILLLGDSKPLLLDFGAARQVLEDSDKALTAILKPSYAPIEQYADMSQLRQGPWTDVYALCAVLYFAISGNAPPSAVARSISDKMVPAVEVGAKRYSARFLRGIDSGLKSRPEARPQSINQLRELLLGGAPTIAKPNAGARPASGEPRPRWHRSFPLALGAVVLLVALGAVGWALGSRFGTDGGPPSGPTDQVSGTVSSPMNAAPSSAVSTGTLTPKVTKPRDESEASAIPSPPASPPPPLPAAPRLNAPARTESQRAEHREPEPSRRVTRDSDARESASAGPNPRCIQILQRWSLGQLPTAEERAILQKEKCK